MFGYIFNLSLLSYVQYCHSDVGGISRLKNYWVYIMASKTGTLYVGVTNDLSRRVHEHKSALTPGFTSKYQVNRLIYFYEFGDVEQAIAMEKMVKGWRREKKIDLIRTINPEMQDLGVDLI